MRRCCCCKKYRDRYRDLEEEDSDSDELEAKRPDRGDPDGGDSENGDSNCEKNDCRTIDLQDQSETRKHPTFNLPSPFKAIDLRNIYNFGIQLFCCFGNRYFKQLMLLIRLRCWRLVRLIISNPD